MRTTNYKRYKSRLDPVISQLEQWFDVECITLRQAQERLKVMGIEIGVSQLGSWWQKQREKKRSAEIHRTRFQHSAANFLVLFLQWGTKARSKDIAESTDSHEEKVLKLGKLMFGEDWK